MTTRWYRIFIIKALQKQSKTVSVSTLYRLAKEKQMLQIIIIQQYSEACRSPLEKNFF